MAGGARGPDRSPERAVEAPLPQAPVPSGSRGSQRLPGHWPRPAPPGLPVSDGPRPSRPVSRERGPSPWRPCAGPRPWRCRGRGQAFLPLCRRECGAGRPRAPDGKWGAGSGAGGGGGTRAAGGAGFGDGTEPPRQGARPAGAPGRAADGPWAPQLVCAAFSLVTPFCGVSCRKGGWASAGAAGEWVSGGVPAFFASLTCGWESNWAQRINWSLSSSWWGRKPCAHPRAGRPFPPRPQSQGPVGFAF